MILSMHNPFLLKQC